MKQLAFVTLSILATATPALASDSTWLLCKGTGVHGVKGDETKTNIVASLHEHRAAGGRDLAVTLIYGVHVSTGDEQGKTLGKDEDVVGKVAALKLATAKKRTVFTGTGELATDMKTYTLKGKIDFTFGDDPKEPQVPFTAKLTCEQLDDASL